MNIKHSNESRRRFIKVGLVTAGALKAGLLASRAAAAELPHLDESALNAKALGYVHDANALTAQVRGGADRACSNCRFFTEDAKDWGPCSLFPGKAVAASGWCKGWVGKA